MTPLDQHPAPADFARLLRDGGDAPPAVAEHLEACPECRARLEQLAMGETGWLLDAARTTAIPAPPELLDSLRSYAGPLTGETLARLETLPDATVDELLPDAAGTRHRVGPYEVLGVVGRGGMGIVLQGHDVVLRRTVALKIPTAAMRGDPVARGRFLREARAAASISHPHVVPVLAVEEYAGVPVLVMAFIQGESLQQRLDREKTLPPAEALRIGLETALALEAAHERGLVHRDVKPANILLQSPDNRVRLTDFGLARAADDARLTQTGLGAGTPLYMSPEQARGDAVDARADLFALGSVLFTMLTGQAPFATTSLMGTLRRLADGSPDSLRAKAPTLPRHVEELIMDLLKTDPADRPATAAKVIERLRDCLRYLAEGTEPPRQRRRRRVLTLAGVLFAATLATAGTVLTFQTPEGTLVVEIDDPDTTVTVDRDGRDVTISGVGVKEVKLKLGDRPVRISGKAGAREEIVTITRDGKTVVKATMVAPGLYGWNYDLSRTRTGLPTPVVVPKLGDPVTPPRIPVLVPAPKDGIHALLAADSCFKCHVDPTKPSKSDVIGNLGRPGALPFIGPMSPARADLFFPTAAPVRCVLASPDGKYVLSASTWPKADETIRVWDAATGAQLHAMEGSKGDIPCLILTPDGKAAVSGSEDGVIRFWDYSAGKQTGVTKAHNGLIVSLAFSPDGKLLASAGADQSIQIRDAKTAELIRAFVGGTNRIRTLAFSPDGKRLLSGGEDENVVMWDVQTGKPMWVSRLDNGWVEKVAFSPDGKSFFAANRSLLVGDPATGKTVAVLQGNGGGITDLVIAPNGKLFATSGSDGQVMLWRTADIGKLGAIRASQGNANQIAFAPDGSGVFVGCGGQYDPKTKAFTPIDMGVRKVRLVWSHDYGKSPGTPPTTDLGPVKPPGSP